MILIRELSEEYVNMCMCVSSGRGGLLRCDRSELKANEKRGIIESKLNNGLRKFCLKGAKN